VCIQGKELSDGSVRASLLLPPSPPIVCDISFGLSRSSPLYHPLYSFPDPCISPASFPTGYGLDGWGSILVRGERLYSSAPRPLLGPTQPPTSWVTGLIPRGKASRA
jgi:hypothetical protein